MSRNRLTTMVVTGTTALAAALLPSAALAGTTEPPATSTNVAAGAPSTERRVLPGGEVCWEAPVGFYYCPAFVYWVF